MSNIDEDLEIREDTEEEKRHQQILAMQQMLTWLEHHPNASLPWQVGVCVFLEEDEARKARQGAYGWVKSDAGNFFAYTKTWGDNRVSYTIYVDKSTSSSCKQVQVGVRRVEAHDEPIYKWECGPEGVSADTVAQAEEL